MVSVSADFSGSPRTRVSTWRAEYFPKPTGGVEILNLRKAHNPKRAWDVGFGNFLETAAEVTRFRFRAGACPFPWLLSRSCALIQWRILLLAEDDLTKLSQSRLGWWPFWVRISTTSPLVISNGAETPFGRSPWRRRTGAPLRCGSCMQNRLGWRRRGSSNTRPFGVNA